MSVFKRLRDVLRSQINADTDPPFDHGSYSAAGSEFDSESHDEPIAKEPQTEEQRYYANLELSPGASFQEIKESYRRLMKQYHPDRHAQDPQKKAIAEQVTIRLNEAWRYFCKKHNQS